ncbi:histone acetyltransferase HAC1-like isoform X2 [Nymphaea colorata]|uniref:histone acetyltransferase HAC1-like isoform X2 n=1 Tax=Nymphaea colorata TaxID=210225 RepID=UPI00129D8FFE|nr:histone acetyltransferase HAC1-like isoform X2 [Nymphaea colorata]
MNVQAHMAGQIAGQLSSQAGPPLPTLPQQNVGSIPSQMQNLGNLQSTWRADPDIDPLRNCVAEEIMKFLRRQPQMNEWGQKLVDIARKLEMGLFRNASSKEEYSDINILHRKLTNVMSRISASNTNQHLGHVNSASSSVVGTMIPTPGMPQSASTNSAVSSMDNSSPAGTNTGLMIPHSVAMGNLLPTANGSVGGMQQNTFNSCDGLLPNEYQQTLPNISIGSGNNMLSSLGTQRHSSQMIPTPGLNDSRSSMNASSGGFSSVESIMASQMQQPKQYIGNQNSRMMQNIGGQMGMGVGMRSGLQAKSSAYGFPGGVLNGGLGTFGNNMPLMSGTAHADGYLSSPAYVNSQKPPQQHFDQQRQQQIMHSGNNQNVNHLGLQSNLKANPMMQSQQSSLPSLQQVSGIKSQSVDHSMKMNLPTSRDLLLQPQQQLQRAQQQQFLQHPHQSQMQFPYQPQQRQLNQQQQQLLKNENLRQPQFPPNAVQTTTANQILPEHEVETHNEALYNQIPDQYQFPNLRHQYQPSHLAENKGSHLLQPSSSQELQHSFSQNSNQFQQIVQPQKRVAQLQNEFTGLSVGQSDIPVTEEWGTLEIRSPVVNQSSSDQLIQADFRPRVMQQDEAQGPHLPTQGSANGKIVSSENYSVAQASCGTLCEAGGRTLGARWKEISNQRRWLLFLRHAKKCSAPKGKCPDKNCARAQDLCRHMEKCHDVHCAYTYCHKTKMLTDHFNNCRSETCALCVPVRSWVSQHRVSAKQSIDSGHVNSTNGTWKTVPRVDGSKMPTNPLGSILEASDPIQLSLKRVKLEHSSPSITQPKVELVQVSSSPVEEIDELEGSQQGDVPVPVPTKSEVMEVKMDAPMLFGSPERISESGRSDLDNSSMLKSEIKPPTSNNLISDFKQEYAPVQKEADQVRQDVHGSVADHTVSTKTGKPKVKGVSMIELFTPEQVRDHILSLRQWVGQSKAKAEKNQAMERSMSENSCQLCAVEKLTFEPPPIYCSTCGARIKRNAMYYTIGSADTRHYFCIPCYNEVRSDAIDVDGVAYPKARMEKKKNDEETEEWWVQCDKCEAWQHQICALFNGRRNDGGQAEYTCPNCYIAEIERGERKPLPQSSVLGAKDLPRTILSDHIENRLFKRLKHERQERANAQGRSFDEVPGAEGLVVRVVSSVDKKLEVKQRFLEIFQEENYPAEFPYKSKAVLLFQRIEGVEVCLFGMYVQEFGSECSFPNQRRVYLSYLDSVKYFRPEIRAVTGEALRTFVYHEILIGYLEYCKNRGFTSCYIWACPPLKGEDYILYCHPEIQKTPKSDKLREWYLSMLRKAAREDVVVDLTNFYDHFFVKNGECKAKVTAARLPYFEGDYWPGAAEDMINQLRQEEDGRKQQKKGKTKKTLTKRALKAAAQADLSSNASKDALLMQKLGETISPMKEDFIMVHLQYPCTHCCQLMVSGKRWVCSRQCKNFQLCDKCYEAEQMLEERDRHPINSKEKHILFPVEVKDVPVDTKDKDDILESEFFDTRQAFLSLCQGNHYQYDTLRRAKHSSMMVLYHLHNPTAPAFVTTCNICYHDIEAGQGWRCETCPDYDVCNTCYQKGGGADHPHKLASPPSTAERDAQNKEARQKRVVQLRKMLDLLIHASQCRTGPCQYPNCRKVKSLFRHGTQCKIRASGGCQLCKRMWYILQLHARACKESDCHVPRCRDLKEHLRRSQQQSDSRRRAAVMEMMRQRAAEVAANNA